MEPWADASSPKALGTTAPNYSRSTLDSLDARRNHSYTRCFHCSKFPS